MRIAYRADKAVQGDGKGKSAIDETGSGVIA